jgi:hypothetical protein
MEITLDLRIQANQRTRGRLGGIEVDGATTRKRRTSGVKRARGNRWIMITR